MARKTAKAEADKSLEEFGDIKSAAEMKDFLRSVRDKMTDDIAPPIYALSAMNHVLNHEKIYPFLTDANKEIARDIWLRLKKSGMQLRNPPLLFDPNGQDVAAP